jgi:hypothetical protein
MKRIIATVALAACAAARAEPARTVFEETFTHGRAKLTVAGWTAHYGATATPFFPEPGGWTAMESSPYINANYLLDNKPGDGGPRADGFSGSEPKLVWTDKIGASGTDVSQLLTVQFQLSRQTAVRPAIQLDGGTTWYVTRRAFAPVATRMAFFRQEQWDALTFEPGVTMAFGGATDLPASGTVTAFGFGYQNAETNNPATGEPVTDDLQLDAIAVEAREEVTGLLAAESFWTTANGYNGMAYTTAKNYPETTNATVSVGNTGFDGTAWSNANNRLQPSSAVSLTHPGVTGVSRPGSTHLRVNNFATVNYRQSCRPLAAEPSATNAYWLSGLIRATALDLNDGEAAAVGFDSTSALNTALTNGFHLGVRKEGGRTYLSAFAERQEFTLRELDESALGRVWQVVLKLTADAQGPDALTAWYARDDEDALTRAFRDAPVETFAGPASIRSLRLTTRARGRSGTDTDSAAYIYADEIRLGTSLEAVTLLREPPPGGTVISVR